MKKCGYFLCSVIAALAFAGCPTNDDNVSGTKTGKVTFFNESSYHVEVHLDAFSGPVLMELDSGQSKTADVRVSENFGIGTMFSILYFYRISDAFDPDSGNVFASGLDPNVQINRVIEENKSIIVQIPQPQKLEFRSAFIKILNTYNMPFELRYLGQVFKQAGNGLIPVAPGKTGVYSVEGIPDGGKQLQNYQVFSNFIATTIPDFTVQNGVIYSFTYDGSSVTKTGEQTIIFN